MPEVILLKFGSRTHMESLLNRGEVHMNSMDFFHDVTSDEVREDPNEGLLKLSRIENGKLGFKKNNIDEYCEIAKINKGIIKESNTSIGILNLFCMFAIDIENEYEVYLSEYIDKRVWTGFGDSVVIIKDQDEFLRRIDFEEKKKDLEVKFNLVKYVDYENYSGELGPFCKDIKYSYQKEARLVAINKEPKELKLFIGSIEDIALIMNANDIPKLRIIDRIGKGNDE